MNPAIVKLPSIHISMENRFFAARKTGSLNVSDPVVSAVTCITFSNEGYQNQKLDSTPICQNEGNISDWPIQTGGAGLAHPTPYRQEQHGGGSSCDRE
jgi:hypothetical protein